MGKLCLLEDANLAALWRSKHAQSEWSVLRTTRTPLLSARQVSIQRMDKRDGRDKRRLRWLLILNSMWPRGELGPLDGLIAIETGCGPSHSFLALSP